MNNETIQISAKNLGTLAMPSCCPRCFWLKLNCKLPYQIFPGIFSSIDSYTKKITWGYYEKFNSLPDWFKPFGDFVMPVKAPGRNIFFVEDEATNVVENTDLHWFRLVRIKSCIFNRNGYNYKPANNGGRQLARQIIRDWQIVISELYLVNNIWGTFLWNHPAYKN